VVQDADQALDRRKVGAKEKAELMQLLVDSASRGGA